jgi:hypothetical protein
MKQSIAQNITTIVSRASCEDKLKTSMPIVLPVVSEILAKVDYGIYLLDLEQRKRPYIARRVLLENSLIANCSYLPHDFKFDDCYLVEEDFEPTAPKLDRFEPLLEVKPSQNVNMSLNLTGSPEATIVVSEGKSLNKNLLSVPRQQKGGSRKSAMSDKDPGRQTVSRGAISP